MDDAERAHPPPVTRSEWPKVAAVVAAFALAYALIGLTRHSHFDSSYDLAAFDQAIWHLSRLETPASTITGHSNILGDHFYPIVALFAPLYRLVPAPETLIVAQAVLLAAAVVPVFVFVRRRLDFAPALALAVAYGLFWGVQRTAWADVHEMAFAPLLIALAVLALDLRRWRLLWAACLLIMITKEDLIAFVGGCGAYLILTGERRRGAWIAAVAGAWFVMVTKLVIPFFNDVGGWSAAGSFDTVMHRPWLAPLVLVTPAAKLVTAVAWFGPFLFLSLASPLGLLVWPVALERLLSDVPNHWGISAHYSAPLAPILAMSAGDGLARLARRVGDRAARARLVAGLAIGCVVMAAILPGHQPMWRLFAAATYAPRPDRAIAARALAMIPANASVVAQAAIAPHLSQRNQVFVLKPGAPDADYLIAGESLSPWPAANGAELAGWIEERRRRGYTTVFDEAGWVVLRR